jgi:hypothetical protein
MRYQIETLTNEMRNYDYFDTPIRMLWLFLFLSCVILENTSVHILRVLWWQNDGSLQSSFIQGTCSNKSSAIILSYVVAELTCLLLAVVKVAQPPLEQSKVGVDLAKVVSG